MTNIVISVKRPVHTGRNGAQYVYDRGRKLYLSQMKKTASNRFFVKNEKVSPEADCYVPLY